MKSTNFLRDAKIHGFVGGVFGWLWLLGSLAGVVWLIGAIFGDFSWFIAIGLLVGAQFAKAVSREYQRASQKAIADGVAADQIYVDASNQARSTDPSAVA